MAVDILGSTSPVVSTAGCGASSEAPAFLSSRPVRTYVYVDGFNLFYRALKGTPAKWLDPMAPFRRVLQPRHRIVCIEYFTARVRGLDNDPHKPQRQDVYLRALRTHIPEIEIHFGHF